MELCQDKLERKLFFFWLEMSHESYKAGALNDNHMLLIKIFRQNGTFVFLPGSGALQAEVQLVVECKGPRDRHKVAEQKEGLVPGVSRPSPKGVAIASFFLY